MKHFLVIASVAMFTFKAFGQTNPRVTDVSASRTNGVKLPPIIIRLQDASKYVGKEVLATGYVVDYKRISKSLQSIIIQDRIKGSNLKVYLVGSKLRIGTSKIQGLHMGFIGVIQLEHKQPFVKVIEQHNIDFVDD
jgi:hypothetical protein